MAIQPRACAPRVYWKEIARRLVIGEKQIDIAQELQRSPATICNTVRHPDFRIILKEAQDKRDDKVYDVAGHFNSHLRKACKTVSDLLDDEGVGPSTRLGAAREILRQTGHGTQAPKGEINVEHLTFEQRVQQAEEQTIEGQIVYDALEEGNGEDKD